MTSNPGNPDISSPWKGRELYRLVEIIARLRGEGGCPWDREQTHESLRSCLLDEAYEFFEAVEEGHDGKMNEELGDLLLQVVLHARIASERNAFDIERVAQGICAKLIRRHPHVFGDVTVSSSSDVVRNWEEIKRGEPGKTHRASLLDDIPAALPALFRAEKVQRRVARAGFDWREIAPVLDKVEEEFGEFRRALESGRHDHAREELGDILFALVNVARHRAVCAEDALREAVAKFTRRFRSVERAVAARGKNVHDCPLEELDALWEESKREERGGE